MRLIQSITTSTSVTSVTFSNIPQTYTNLFIFISANSFSATDFIQMTYNNTDESSGPSYYVTAISGTVSSASTGASPIGIIPGFTPSAFSSTSVYIPNYSANSVKVAHSLSGRESVGSSRGIGYFVNGDTTYNTPITSLKFSYSASLNSGSAFYLYGV